MQAVEQPGSFVAEVFAAFGQQPQNRALVFGRDYHRSLQHEYRLREQGNLAELERLLTIAGSGRKRVEEVYKGLGELGPYTDFELGVLNGKLSALRWVLGSEWDFLDT
ncbi:hypothetical protein [Arthrobacter sp. ISL-72]|uniref:hypothetical protein n=1 Tax=Arthrobacter sp. ISL-72 TaxID=2819114 RepID=UPI001BE626D5|nr:hypothetical protein [Arthrobacter sp. ISL-72]MBT2594068.1 hypothetical protein [Arthrobacter sp. ISL-72]